MLAPQCRITHKGRLSAKTLGKAHNHNPLEDAIVCTLQQIRLQVAYTAAPHTLLASPM
jgi:hypothetical protein